MANNQTALGDERMDGAPPDPHIYIVLSILTWNPSARSARR